MFPFISIPGGIIDAGKIGNIAGKIADNLPPINDLNSGSSVSQDTPSDSDSSSDESPKDYNFLEYLEGLFASQGAENEVNRKFNSAESAINRDFQSREAAVQRNWYEQMSNTAYQRAVADMQKAGINPILAYQQGGASSSGTGIATGSAASYNATGGDTFAGILNAVSNLVDSISGISSGKLSSVYRIFNLFR